MAQPAGVKPRLEPQLALHLPLHQQSSIALDASGSGVRPVVAGSSAFQSKTHSLTQNAQSPKILLGREWRVRANPFAWFHGACRGTIGQARDSLPLTTFAADLVDPPAGMNR